MSKRLEELEKDIQKAHERASEADSIAAVDELRELIVMRDDLEMRLQTERKGGEGVEHYCSEHIELHDCYDLVVEPLFQKKSWTAECSECGAEYDVDVTTTLTLKDD